MGFFGRRVKKPAAHSETLIYESLQWEGVMFRDWPELQVLNYWERFRTDSRMQGNEGVVNVVEYYDIEPMMQGRLYPRGGGLPMEYHFTVVMPNGVALLGLEDVNFGQLMMRIAAIPPEATLLRHLLNVWPRFNVDVMRNAGQPLTHYMVQLRTAPPRSSR